MVQKQYRQGSAALWFAMDGYSTEKGVNGRRIAGLSFLKGYLRHARAEKLVAYGSSRNSVVGFAKLCRSFGDKREVTGGLFEDLTLPNRETNLYLPTPNIGGEAWRRSRIGATKYSISGVTHTISTERVMNALANMAWAPTQSWDAVICTSKAVLDSVTFQLDALDDHFKHRFGMVPDRYQTPVIPLGINTDDFQITSDARALWRQDLNIGNDDIVVVTVARLASFEKFDPIPLFMSLQNAAQTCSQKVHLIGLGQYSDNVAKKMYENGCRTLAPDVTFHHLDGAKDQNKRNAIAAADIFTLPVDNIQETFGLSPVESMAAGLPVVVTDWNGFKDTVNSDCGFLIPTTGPTPGAMAHETERYWGKQDNYNQFIGLASQMTTVDIKAMSDAFSALFNSADLRKTMGASGKKRALDVFDWKHIIPQYEDLWAELDERRVKATNDGLIVRNSPAIPDATRMFANYPTSIYDPEKTLVMASKFANMSPEQRAEKVVAMVELRGLRALKRKTTSNAVYIEVFEFVAQHGPTQHRDIENRPKAHAPQKTERAVLWLLKYGFIEFSD